MDLKEEKYVYTHIFFSDAVSKNVTVTPYTSLLQISLSGTLKRMVVMTIAKGPCLCHVASRSL